MRASSCVSPADPPPVETSRDGLRRTEMSVLIYNVEGLPWPARRGRGPSLDRIGRELARLRRERKAPDVVLLQEAFSRRAARIGRSAGYPFMISAPGARDRRSIEPAVVPGAFRRARRFAKGERSGKLLGSGLMVLSAWPIVAWRAEPFSRHACAGFDCLANKGVLLARVQAPGVPRPVDVVTTHMNARKAAGVPEERSLAAYRFQTDESARFLARFRDERNPLVFGGDFNMRRAPDRLDHFSYRKPYHIVRHYCTVVVADCDVRMSWDGDAPWLDTQDLQIFDDGGEVKLRPVRAEALFDGPETGGKLSDHDGFLVTNSLSWRADTRNDSLPPAVCPARAYNPHSNAG